MNEEVKVKMDSVSLLIADLIKTLMQIAQPILPEVFLKSNILHSQVDLYLKDFNMIVL